jgi:RsiW-degrading membrane proteinase PrsW (M82 family)
LAFDALFGTTEVWAHMLIVLVAILGALIPTIFYVAMIWWLDRYEKEPLWLLALAFLWGAFPAAIASVLVELAFDIPIAALGGESLVANLASASISVPLVEESAKGIALIGLVLVFRHEFDDVLDGIVYGAMIGLGFAFTENLFAYFLPILREEGISSGLVNILLRTLVFGFTHAFWTGIIGATVGYARLSRDWGQRILVPFAGWSVAVLLHAIHNAGATLVEQTACLSLGVSLLVDWGGVILLVSIAVLILHRESQWIEQGLVEEVRQGVLSPQEFDLLRSAGQRTWVRWRAWNRGGRTAYRAVGRYFQLATELAFKKEHLRSLRDEGANLDEVQRLQQALAASRAIAWPWLWPTPL